MRLAIPFISTVFLTVAMATSPPHPCQCWPEWDPINENNDWHCKEKTLKGTFACNIDVPPKCICKEKGKEVELPLGEINCVHTDHSRYDNRDCETNGEWKKWFEKYPHYRLYDTAI